MSASKARSSQYFYSNLQVESDQKEVIISHLKQQIYHLKKNQQQFFILEEQYRNLDHKYRLLSEQKIICDGDFKERHELALRNICELKNEIDALRAELRDRNLEVTDLKTDQNTLKNQLDEKYIEIQRLKSDLSSLLTDNEELLNERVRLDQIASGVRKDNDSLISNLKSTQIDNESVKRKIGDLQKYYDQLRNQDAILRQKILGYQSQNNQLDSDINATMQDISALDNKIADAQQDIVNLQTDIAEINGLSQKYKSESLHYQKATQNEVMKNNDTAKQISQAENIQRVRVNQVEEGRRQVATLQGENQGLNKVNVQLEDDLQFCRRHLENLALLNNDLVINLQRYSEQDDVVRNLIDRKNRIIRYQSRVDQVGNMVMTRSTMAGTGYSPVRKSKIGY